MYEMMGLGTVQTAHQDSICRAANVALCKIHWVYYVEAHILREGDSVV